MGTPVTHDQPSACLVLTHCVFAAVRSQFATLRLINALKVIVAGTAENCLIRHEALVRKSAFSPGLLLLSD